MAGKKSKKNQNNFEKMKREMTAKKEKAKMQQNLETLQISTESNVFMKKLSTDAIAKQHEECPCVVTKDIDECKDDFIVEKEFEEVIIEKMYQDDKVHNHNKDKQDDIIQQYHKKDIKESNKIEIVVFRVGEEEFALKISNIKEIIRVPAMINIPNKPNYIVGLCNLRDALMPVIDSRKLFGMGEKEFDENSRIVVADIHGKKVGLVSDKVSEVINVDEADIKEPPGSIKENDEGMISSILILNNGKRVVMLLDAEKIIKVGHIDVMENKQHINEQNLNVLEMKEDEEEQLVIFNIGTGEYAFNINSVKEIIRLPDIMKVPNVPSYIEGVLSIRNQLLAIINIGKLLDINYKEPDEYSRVVIINDGNFSFGMIVDKVSHVIRVQKKLFKEISKIANSSYIKGIFNIDDGKRLIMVLEPRKLISLEEIEGISNVNHNETVNDKSLYVGEEDYELEHIVIFKLGDEEYGVEINNVQEINVISEITRFPSAPIFIAGMVNLRGEIIPILNLRKLFTACDSVTYDAGKFLVVESQNRRIGIMIDSASEILRFSKRHLEEVPEIVNGNDKYIEKIAKLNDGKRIVLILNLEEVLSFM